MLVAMLRLFPGTTRCLPLGRWEHVPAPNLVEDDGKLAAGFKTPGKGPDPQVAVEAKVSGDGTG